MTHTLAGFLKAVTIGAVMATLALPFAREVYERQQVVHSLDSIIDQRDRAAFANWPGSAASFIAAVYERCLRESPGHSSYCERYRAAAR